MLADPASTPAVKCSVSLAPREKLCRTSSRSRIRSGGGALFAFGCLTHVRPTVTPMPAPFEDLSLGISEGRRDRGHVVTLAHARRDRAARLLRPNRCGRSAAQACICSRNQSPLIRACSDHGQRKTDHLDLTISGDVGFRRTTLLEEVTLVHQPLPELALSEVDLGLRLFGRKVASPDRHRLLM